MKTINFLYSVLGAATSFIHTVQAQDFATHGVYTETNTGIIFYTSSQPNGDTPGGYNTLTSWGGFTWGVALPQNAVTVDTKDYLGLIIGSTPSTPKDGWTGIVQGADLPGGGSWGGMLNHMMIVAWPTGVGNNIATSFRYATSYDNPVPYNGTAVLTQLYANVNSTHWTLVYKCQNCLLYDDPSQTAGKTSSTQGNYQMGWGQSYTGPVDKTNPAADIIAHNNGMGFFQVQVASATQASYSKWATMTGIVVPTATPTATPTTSFSSTPVPTGATYDYIVVGGGAGGIPLADKLSASGKSVLLIEKGVASSARWGGTMRPESGWLNGYNLTWFDVPGQCNRIWNGGASGVACSDTDQMAGCILGGGTAINAGLWWKPNPADWDVNFPTGWKSADMAPATQRVFSRIPGTDLPSMDGQRYIQSGFEVVRAGLAQAGWKSVTANNVPDQKNRTYAHTPYMYSNGERGGPMATYLVSAKGRPNFHMWLNTSVERVVRSGGHATALTVKATNNGGYSGNVNLTPTTGRVVLAAGAFGTPKLLFRSGIGPTDQLNIVKSSIEGPTMINSSYWINLPVGYNLDDHLNTDTVISHPNVTYYDWPASWIAPNATDKAAYFTKRSGPFAQAAPNIGPLMFEEIKGPDGITRQFQWTSRVEGSGGVANGNTMTLSLYLGRGSISRGRTVITNALNMVVDTIPYGNVNDLATVAKAIDNMVAALSPVKGLSWVLPLKNTTGAQYLASLPLTYANIGARRANHWLGTAKMGTDSGLNGGTSVVDTNTKVYGTDNIFVVDASIFPGMPSTNPSALIVTAAERASEVILALPALTTVARYQQCGGLNYMGSQVCASPYTCIFGNSYYSQCL